MFFLFLSPRFFLPFHSPSFSSLRFFLSFSLPFPPISTSSLPSFLFIAHPHFRPPCRFPRILSSFYQVPLTYNVSLHFSLLSHPHFPPIYPLPCTPPSFSPIPISIPFILLAVLPLSAHPYSHPTPTSIPTPLLFSHFLPLSFSHTHLLALFPIPHSHFLAFFSILPIPISLHFSPYFPFPFPCILSPLFPFPFPRTSPPPLFPVLIPIPTPSHVFPSIPRSHSHSQPSQHSPRDGRPPSLDQGARRDLPEKSKCCTLVISIILFFSLS